MRQRQSLHQFNQFREVRCCAYVGFHFVRMCFMRFSMCTVLIRLNSVRRDPLS